MLVASVALSNIQEQRARLPPATTDPCVDAVQGVWRAHAFYPHVREWYIFELLVQRVPGSATALTGSMYSHYWTGSPSDEQPPACAPGVYRRSVTEPATGTANGLQINFDGTSWRPAADYCGAPADGYNLDHFSGRIDPALQEFQSVLNAPGWVNVPTVFRRIRCVGTAQASTTTPLRPPTKVAAPPLTPQSRGACGCRVPGR